MLPSMSTIIFAHAVNCRDTDSLDLLSARPRSFTGTEAASVPPESSPPLAHDAFTRRWHRREPDPATLGSEVRPLVHRTGGVLVLDDSTLDQPSAQKIDLVARPWSGSSPETGTWNPERPPTSRGTN
jgi:putative transposase